MVISFTDDNDIFNLKAVLKVESTPDVLRISISYQNDDTSKTIELSRQSAIRLSKELRRQISMMEEDV